MSIWQRIVLSMASALVIVALAASFPAAHTSAQVFSVCNQGGASGSAVCHAPTANNISGPNGIIIKVSNIFAWVGGVGAVFVILIGALMYITAAGDSGKANSGRSAVIYATVGLVVIVLGRVIIGFVVTKF
jgi:hypothetical protein